MKLKSPSGFGGNPTKKLPTPLGGGEGVCWPPIHPHTDPPTLRMLLSPGGFWRLLLTPDICNAQGHWTSWSPMAVSNISLPRNQMTWSLTLHFCTASIGLWTQRAAEICPPPPRERGLGDGCTTDRPQISTRPHPLPSTGQPLVRTWSARMEPRTNAGHSNIPGPNDRKTSQYSDQCQHRRSILRRGLPLQGHRDRVHRARAGGGAARTLQSTTCRPSPLPGQRACASECRLRDTRHTQRHRQNVLQRWHQ